MKVARPTLRTIADKLGVSTATVSLAMRDSKKISSAVRKRVKAALVEEGYVYQRSAAGLRTSKTHTVGVIVNNVSNPFFSTLLASLEEALARTGRTVFLCNTDESVPRQTDFIRKMWEYNADGIIISPSIEFDGALVRSSVPTRLAGFRAARWIAELTPRPTAAIGYNDAIALGLSAGLQREGLFPGRNFALIGHEDVEEASLANPPLSVTRCLATRWAGRRRRYSLNVSRIRTLRRSVSS